MKINILIKILPISVLAIAGCVNDSDPSVQQSSLFQKKVWVYEPAIDETTKEVAFRAYHREAEGYAKDGNYGNKIFINNSQTARDKYKVKLPCNQSVCTVIQNTKVVTALPEKYYVFQDGSVVVSGKEALIKQNMTDKVVLDKNSNTITTKKVVALDMGGKLMTAANLNIVQNHATQKLRESITSLKLRFPAGTTCYTQTESPAQDYLVYHTNRETGTYATREEAEKAFLADKLYGFKGKWGGVSWFMFSDDNIIAQSIKANLNHDGVALVDKTAYLVKMYKKGKSYPVQEQLTTDSCIYFDNANIALIDDMLKKVVQAANEKKA